MPRAQDRRGLGQGEGPLEVPQHRLLRPPCLRRRGGREDVLLQARARPRPRAGGAARRACRRRRAATTRCATRRRRSPAATRCCARWRTPGALSRSDAAKLQQLPLNLRPTRIYSTIRERPFFEYVRQQLVDAYGERGTRRGGLRVFTTIEPRMQKLARAGDRLDARPQAATRPRRSSPSTRRPARSARWRRASTDTGSTSTSPRRARTRPARPSRPFVLIGGDGAGPEPVRHATTCRRRSPTRRATATRSGRCTPTRAPTTARSRSSRA